jgi:hydrogenase-4 component D
MPPRRENLPPVPPSTGGNGLFLLALLLSALAMCGSLGIVIRSRGAIRARDIGSLPWLPSKEPLFGVRIDALSCLMLLAVTICGFLIILYSGAYMSRGNREHPSDKGQGRYYFFMVLFVAAMIGLVCSPNLFQLFIFWELTTLCSWGLISFYGDQTALLAGYKALLMTYAAGMFLLAGVTLVYINTGSFAFSAINLLAPSTKSLVIVFLAIAAFGKAAQFPFQTWLPSAMTAPTPATAYLHAAAMVKAGVYLMARLVLTATVFPPKLALLFSAMAIVTMYIGVLQYAVQDDLKRLLAYSTIANLGYMMLGLAMGALGSPIALRGGLLHLIGHAFTKSLLFLAVGAVSYATGTRSIAHLSGLGKRMPVTALAFVIGAMAISGVPPFNLFWSKFLIVAGAIQLNTAWGVVLAVLVLAESVIGFACFLRVVHKVFLGPVSEAADAAQDPPAGMLTALIVLMALALFSTLFALPLIGRIVHG